MDGWPRLNWLNWQWLDDDGVELFLVAWNVDILDSIEGLVDLIDSQQALRLSVEEVINV